MTLQNPAVTTAPSSPRFALAASAAVFVGSLFASSTTAFAATGDSIVPDVSSYAAIDEALTGCLLLPRGAQWRYFPGVAEPSPKEEWTELDFDDSAWAEGPSPFVAGKRVGGTRIPEMAEGVTTLYLRCGLSIPDLSLYARIQLELPIDDGFVFYLNGDQKRRLHAGDPAIVPAFNANASGEREWSSRPLPQVDLEKELKSGDSMLALQALLHASDVDSFGVDPKVRATYRVTPEGERTRLEELLPLLQGEGDSARREYLEGRHLQRLGEFADASTHFRRAAELDSSALLPWTRLVECHRALGTLTDLGVECRALFGTELDTPALRDTWASFFLNDLGGSPTELADIEPLSDQAGRVGVFADAAFVGSVLEDGGPLRLNSGRSTAQELEDVQLRADRFFAPATRAVAQSGEGYLTATRVCTRSLDDLAPAYRIPLPSGAYEVRLAFGGTGGSTVEVGDSVFDVILEGARVLTDYDPMDNAGRRGLDVRRFALEVSDGFLELDLLPQSPRDPWIAGIEVHSLAPLDFLRHAERAADRTGGMRAFELAQLGNARRLSGDLAGALTAFEAAEELPGFLAPDRLHLSAVRDALLPILSTFASVDDLVERHFDEGDTLLANVRHYGQEDEELVTYLAGRLHQMAGRLEDALGAFEGLVMDGSKHDAPYLRMAECLVDVGLRFEAAGILEEALAAGVRPSADFIQYWIGLNLGELERDPWNVLEDLRTIGVSERIADVPTSKEVPQEWRISLREPPTTAWSRNSYGATAWDLGLGSLGAGHVVEGTARSLWNIETVFARRTFELSGASLLYPHVLVNANDAGDVYLNGTRVVHIGVATGGYLMMPLRGSAVPQVSNSVGPEKATGLLDGPNVLGIYGFNVRGAASYDAGIVQPIDELLWIADRLREDGVLRLNCGGEEFTGPEGEVWYADRFFGWALNQEFTSEPRPEIHGTSNDELYVTNRWFYSDTTTTWYQIPLPNGTYQVTLHFAELEDDARKFDILLEEEIVLEDYDVLASAGLRTAATLTFEAVIEDGWLDIRTFDKDDRSFFSGIEIAPAGR